MFMQHSDWGLEHPKEYASIISADSQGNGQIAAQILASCVDKGGTIGLVNFGVDYFSTNERTKGVLNGCRRTGPTSKWSRSLHRPGEGVPDRGRFSHRQSRHQGRVRGVGPAGARHAFRDARKNIDIPVTTVDLGLQSAIEIAKGGPLKATGSQRPYDQGAAEAMAMMNALIGKEYAGLGRRAIVAGRSVYVLNPFKTVFKKDCEGTRTRTLATWLSQRAIESSHTGAG